MAYIKESKDELDMVPRLPAGTSMVTYLRMLLELAPECEGFPNERATRLSKLCGKTMRNFALGTISCIGFCSRMPPTREADRMRMAEEEAKLAARVQTSAGFPPPAPAVEAVIAPPVAASASAADLTSSLLRAFDISEDVVAKCKREVIDPSSLVLMSEVRLLCA